MNGTVLIVEDEGIIADDIAEILTGENYAVCGIVACGDEAVTAARTLRPDLVLMDIMLPGELDGVDAAALITRIGIPVVFVTAHSNELLMKRAMDVLPYGYLVKPINRRELLAVVGLSIKRHISERGARASERAGPAGRDPGGAAFAGTSAGIAIDDGDRSRTALLADIIDGLPHLVCRFTDDLLLTYANKAYCAFFGKPIDAAAGARFLDILPAAERAMLQNHIDLIRQTMTEREYFAEISAEDGSSKWIKWTTRPIIAADGRTTGFQSVGEDITPLKSALERLKAAEEKFARAFHHSPVMGSITRMSDGTFLEINDSYEGITGYSRGELIGRTAVEIGIWSSEAREKALALVRSNGHLRNHEVEITCKSGEARTVLLSIEPILIDREPVSIGMAVDITERKRVEAELRHREDMLTRLIENASGVVALQDLRGNILFAAGSVRCARSPHPAAAHPGSPAFDRLMEAIRPLDSAVLDERTEIVEERPIVHDSGTCYFLVQKYPIRDEHAAITAIGTIARDITDVRTLEKEALMAAAAERQRISHRLHDDLGQRLSYLGFAMESMRKSITQPTPAQRKDLREISRIITEAIEYAKDTAREMHPVTADTERFMHSLRDFIAQNERIYKKAVRVDIACRLEGLGDFICDTLYSILTEGIHNALKHGDGDVTLRIRRANDALEVLLENPIAPATGGAAAGGGMGLGILRHRAVLIGASLATGVADGRFALSIALPLAGRRAE